MDTSIVKDSVDLLAPAMPFLMDLGAEAARVAVQKLGEAAWEGAKAIWSKLRAKLATQPTSKTAIEALAKNPDNEDARGALRMIVRELVKTDQELAKALAQIALQSKPVIANGERSVAIGGSAQGAVIVTGNNNAVGASPRKNEGPEEDQQ
jgi:hypothetical protein